MYSLLAPAYSNSYSADNSHVDGSGSSPAGIVGQLPKDGLHDLSRIGFKMQLDGSLYDRRKIWVTV